MGFDKAGHDGFAVHIDGLNRTLKVYIATNGFNAVARFLAGRVLWAYQL